MLVVSAASSARPGAAAVVPKSRALLPILTPRRVVNIQSNLQHPSTSSSSSANIGMNLAQTRHYAAVKRGGKGPSRIFRIEEKMGVGLRYRRPRTWDGSKRAEDATYDADAIKAWREEFNMPVMQHSMGKLT